jgi:hypothetical protein
MIRGVAGFLWLGGPDNRGAVGAENSTAEGTLGNPPPKFSHRIFTNLKGPPDRPWGVRTPGRPRPATPLLMILQPAVICVSSKTNTSRSNSLTSRCLKPTKIITFFWLNGKREVTKFFYNWNISQSLNRAIIDDWFV